MKMTLLANQSIETIAHLSDDLMTAIAAGDISLWHEDDLNMAPADRSIVIEGFVEFFIAEMSRPFASAVEAIVDSWSGQVAVAAHWLTHARDKLGWTDMSDEWTDLPIASRKQILEDIPQLFGWLDAWCEEHAHTDTIVAPHIDPHLKPSRR